MPGVPLERSGNLLNVSVKSEGPADNNALVEPASTEIACSEEVIVESVVNRSLEMLFECAKTLESDVTTDNLLTKGI